jgi:hypothetical protein
VHELPRLEVERAGLETQQRDFWPQRTLLSQDGRGCGNGLPNVGQAEVRLRPAHASEHEALFAQHAL